MDILEIGSKYSIFTDHKNNDDDFHLGMDWNEYVDYMHNLSKQLARRITPPMDEPPAPAMLTAYNNHQSSSSSSSTSLSNNNNDYSEQVSSVASLRK